MNTSVELPKTESSRRSWTQRLRRALLVYVVLPYVGVFAVLACFQRYLMYRPATEVRLDSRQAGFPTGQVRDIALQTTDGLELHGWHFLPDGEQATDADAAQARLDEAEWVVLYFTGNGGNRKTHAEGCRDFTSRGCHVIYFDHRGFGDNPGSPNQRDCYADALAAWDYLTQQRSVPAEKIVLFGESLGGAMAVYLAAETSRQGTPPAGLALNCTFDSMTAAAGAHFPWLPVSLVLLDRYPSATHIADVSCPLLQFHVAGDETVPYRRGAALHEAAPAESSAGIPKRFVTVPGDRHNHLPADVLRRELDPWLALLRQISIHRP